MAHPVEQGSGAPSFRPLWRLMPYLWPKGRPDLRARVVVSDDGPGMTPRQQEMAFRRFVSSTPGGAGLGLAIVHRLVTSNGGSAALSDTPGGGLTVTVTLPAGPPERARRIAEGANPGAQAS